MEMTLLGKPSADWWKVELRGKVGLVPAKLVQPLVRPADAAATGNTHVSVVDTAATLRTQKAQQMAVASAVAQGRAPGVVVAPVVSKLRSRRNWGVFVDLLGNRWGQILNWPCLFLPSATRWRLSSEPTGSA